MIYQYHYCPVMMHRLRDNIDKHCGKSESRESKGKYREISGIAQFKSVMTFLNCVRCRNCDKKKEKYREI